MSPGPLSHGAGTFTVLAIASVVAVHALGISEIGSPGFSLFVHLLFASLYAIAGGAGFAIALQILRRRATARRAYLLGCLDGVVLVAFLWVVALGPSFAVGLAAAFLVSAVSALACVRAEA